MDLFFFVLSLGLAIAGPVIAIAYLRPILTQVMVGLCDARGGAEFWVRCCYILAVCGSLVLMLAFGMGPGEDPVASLRRSLLLVLGATFFSVALISRNVWAQVRLFLARRDAAMAQAAATPEAAAGVGSAS